MKKVMAALLAVAAVSVVVAPGMVSHTGYAYAQAAKPITIDDPAEFAMYDAASKLTDPKAQAPAFEAYLAKYPKSVLKLSIQKRIMLDYSAFDNAKTITAADAVLQTNPNDFQALVLETTIRYAMANQMTDPASAAARQTQLDSAADFAKKALVAPKPDDLTDDQFKGFKANLAPTLHSIIGNDAFAKKDYPAAIDGYKAELGSVDPAKTQVPGPILADTFLLADAYLFSTPPDLVSCTFYATRAATYAPAEVKPQFQQTADYCYKKFHGGADGYDVVKTAAAANVNPPADLKITPAPTPEEQVHTLITSTPDLAQLALSDKEYILANGSPDDAEKVFATIKGKPVEYKDVTVISATADQVVVSISDDAVASKTADFTFNMKTPLKTVPDVGSKITLSGTYTSYTQKPMMITMSDGEVVVKKAPVKAPVHRHK
jgi:hypothetical protein